MVDSYAAGLIKTYQYENFRRFLSTLLFKTTRGLLQVPLQQRLRPQPERQVANARRLQYPPPQSPQLPLKLKLRRPQKRWSRRRNRLSLPQTHRQLQAWQRPLNVPVSTKRFLMKKLHVQECRWYRFL